LRFVGLAVAGVATRNAPQIGRRDPVLAFGGDEVVGEAEEGVDGDGGTDFFQGFADGALFEGFQIVEFAADDAPAAGLGRAAAESY
jgi:hypothetical protein